MNDEFDNINLYLVEKIKLFVMRFKKRVNEKFLGSSMKMLLDIRFITSDYPFIDSVKTDVSCPTSYSLTDRYFRYCVYRRRQFFDSKLWPFVISIAASVITSILTTLLLR